MWMGMGSPWWVRVARPVPCPTGWRWPRPCSTCWVTTPVWTIPCVRSALTPSSSVWSSSWSRQSRTANSTRWQHTEYNTEYNTEQHLSQTILITGIMELKIFKKGNCIHVFYFILGIENGKNLDRFHLIIHASVKCITSPQDRALEWLWTIDLKTIAMHYMSTGEYSLWANFDDPWENVPCYANAS